ncbi:1322_t:CDS:2, partial [Entrophospora sp. SA101]
TTSRKRPLNNQDEPTTTTSTLVETDEEVIKFDNLGSTNQLNIIVKLLRRSSPGVNQYFNEFKNFFTDNEAEEDSKKRIEVLESEMVKMKSRIVNLKKKLALEMNIIEALEEENQELKEQTLKCNICLVENITHCFAPCHHLVASIGTFASAGISVRRETVMRHKKKQENAHDDTVSSFVLKHMDDFMMINLDDYHNIHTTK